MLNRMFITKQCTLIDISTPISINSEYLMIIKEIRRLLVSIIKYLKLNLERRTSSICIIFLDIIFKCQHLARGQFVFAQGNACLYFIDWMNIAINKEVVFDWSLLFGDTIFIKTLIQCHAHPSLFLYFVFLCVIF